MANVVKPAMTDGGHLSVQTSGSGATWVTIGGVSLRGVRQLTLSNQTGTTIEVRQDGAGVGFQIPTGAFYTFFGLLNSSELQVRRVDQSNTQVTITARWEG